MPKISEKKIDLQSNTETSPQKDSLAGHVALGHEFVLEKLAAIAPQHTHFNLAKQALLSHIGQYFESRYVARALPSLFAQHLMVYKPLSVLWPGLAQNGVAMLFENCMEKSGLNAAWAENTLSTVIPKLLGKMLKPSGDVGKWLENAFKATRFVEQLPVLPFKAEHGTLADLLNALKGVSAPKTFWVIGRHASLSAMWATHKQIFPEQALVFVPETSLPAYYCSLVANALFPLGQTVSVAWQGKAEVGKPHEDGRQIGVFEPSSQYVTASMAPLPEACLLWPGYSESALPFVSLETSWLPERQLSSEFPPLALLPWFLEHLPKKNWLVWRASHDWLVSQRLTGVRQKLEQGCSKIYVVEEGERATAILIAQH
jgi:hypothetical protein